MSTAGRLTVDGLKDFRSDIKRMGDDFPKELQKENKEVASEVAAVARSAYSAEHDGGSGRSAATYRGLATQTSAAVAMGAARQPWVLGQDFGSHQGKGKKQFPIFVKGGRYLYPAIAKAAAKLPARYAQALEKVAAKAFPGRGL